MKLTKGQIQSVVGTDTSEQITPGTNAPGLSLPLIRQISLGNLQGQYKEELFPDQDWDDLRALRQSFADKLANGLLKAGATAATTALEPFVNLFYGIPKFFFDTQEFNSIFDNEITQSFDSFNDYMRENFPNYYTKAEQNSSLFGGMLYQNFWTDKFLNGVGFLAGAALSGGVAARAISSTAKIISSGQKGLRSLSTVANKTDDAIKSLTEASNLIQFNKKTAAAASVLTAIGESGIEGRHAAKEFYEDIIHKRDSGDPKYANLTDEDIKNLSKDVGNSTFLLNMPVVTGANLLFLGKFFAGQAAAGGGAKSIAPAITSPNRYTGRAITEYGIKAGKPVVAKASELTKFDKFVNTVRALEVPASEFGQEMSQGVISRASNDYFTRSLDPDAADFVSNIMMSTVTAAKDAFGSKEGLEEGLIGALLGAFRVPSSIKSIKGENAKTKLAEEFLNKYKSSDAFKIRENFIKTDYSIQKSIAEALEKGDTEAVKRLSDDSFFNYVYSRNQLGLGELIKDDINSLKKMTLEDFNSFIEAEKPLTEEEKAEYISQAENKAKLIQDVQNLIETRIPDADNSIKEAFIKSYYDKQAVLSRMNELEGVSPISIKSLREAAHQEFLEELNKQKEENKLPKEEEKKPVETEEEKNLKKEIADLENKRKEIADNLSKEDKDKAEQEKEIEKLNKEINKRTSKVSELEAARNLNNLNKEKETNKVIVKERELTESEKEPLIIKPFIKDKRFKRDIKGEQKETIGKRVSPMEEVSFKEFEIFRRKIEESYNEKINQEQDPLKKEELKEQKEKLLRLSKEESDTMVLYNMLIKDPDGYLSLKDDIKQIALKEMFTVKMENFSGKLVDTVLEKGVYRDSRGQKMEILETHISPSGKPMVLARINNTVANVEVSKFANKRFVKETKLNKRDNFAFSNLNNVITLRPKPFVRKTQEVRDVEQGSFAEAIEEEIFPAQEQDFVFRVNDEVITDKESKDLGRNKYNSWTLVSLDGKTKIAVNEENGKLVFRSGKQVYEMTKGSPIEESIFEKEMLRLGKNKRALYDSLKEREENIKNAESKLGEIKKKISYLSNRITRLTKAGQKETKVTKALREKLGWRQDGLKVVDTTLDSEGNVVPIYGSQITTDPKKDKSKKTITFDELVDIKNNLLAAAQEQRKFIELGQEELKNIEVKKQEAAIELQRLRNDWKSNMTLEQARKLRKQYKDMFEGYEQHIAELEQALVQADKEFDDYLKNFEKQISDFRKAATREINKLPEEQKEAVREELDTKYQDFYNNLLKTKEELLQRSRDISDKLALKEDEFSKFTVEEITNAKQLAKHYDTSIKAYERRITELRQILYGKPKEAKGGEMPTNIDTNFEDGLRPDIYDVRLGKTAGSHIAALRAYDNGDKSPAVLAQLRFFDYLDKLDSIDGHIIAFIHRGNIDKLAKFGITPEQISFYEGDPNHVVGLILKQEDGKTSPVIHNNPDGKTSGIVYNSIPLSVFDDKAYTNKNELTKEQIAIIEQTHSEFLKTILGSSEATFTEITGISNGILNPDLKDKVITKPVDVDEISSIEIATNEYGRGIVVNGSGVASDVRRGSSWIIKNGKLRRLQGQRIGKTKAKNLIVALAQLSRDLIAYQNKEGRKASQQIPSYKNIKLLDYISNNIFFGNYSNQPENYRIYIDQDLNSLFFGGNFVSLEQLANIHQYPEIQKELMDFLQTVYSNINSNTLKKEGRYNELLGNIDKTGVIKFEIKEWPSYKHALLSQEQYGLDSNGLEIKSKELMHGIEEPSVPDTMTTPHYINTYVRFDNGNFSKEIEEKLTPKKKEQKETKKETKKEEPNTTGEKIENYIKYPFKVGENAYITNFQQHLSIENQQRLIEGDRLIKDEQDFIRLYKEDKENITFRPGNELDISLGNENSEDSSKPTNKDTDTEGPAPNPEDWKLTAKRSSIKTPEYVKANIAKELIWFQKKFPNFPIEVIQGLIENRAYGRFISNSKVLISDLAVEGTTYHESFHVVSRILLTDKQRSILYDEYRQQTGNKNLSDFEVEEALAEEFRMFALNDGDFKSTNLRPRQRSFFRRMWDWIKQILGMNPRVFNSIEETFNTIYNNSFEDITPLSNSIPQSWNMISELAVKIDELSNSLFSYITSSILNDPEDIKLLTNLNTEQDREKLKGIIEKHRLKSIDFLVEDFEQGIAEGKITRKKYEEVRNFFAANKDQVISNVISKFANFGVFENLEIDDENIKTRNQFDSKDTISFHASMPLPIKLILSAIPSQQKVVKSGNFGLLSLDDVDSNKLVRNFTPSGFPQVENYASLSALIHNEISNIVDENTKIQKLIELSYSRPAIKKVLEYVGLASGQQVESREKFDLQTMFIGQMSKAKHQHSLTIVDEKGIGSLDAVSASKFNKIKDIWKANLKTGLKFVKNENNNYRLDINGILSAYPTIKNARTATSFLSELGIETKKPLNSNINLANRIKDSLKNYQKETNLDTIPVDQIYNSNIIKISNELKEVLENLRTDNREDLELSYLGPDGKSVFMLLPHQTISTVVSLLNDGLIPNYISDSIYSKNSQIVNKKIQVKIGVIGGMNNARESYNQIPSKLGDTDFTALEIGALLENKLLLFPAGDKKTENTLELSSPLDITTDAFLTYLQDEIDTANAFKKVNLNTLLQIDKNGVTDLTFFKNIADKSMSKDKKRIAINKHFQEKAEDLSNLLIEKEIVTPVTREDKVIINGLPTFILLNNYNGKKVEGGVELSIESYNKMLDSIVRTYKAGLIEQTKLFTNNLALNDKFIKRMGGNISPKNTSRNSPEFIHNLNKFYPRNRGTRDQIFRYIALEDREETMNEEFISFLKKIGLSNKEISAYQKMKATDGFSYLTFDSYRDMQIRGNIWNNEKERIFQAVNKGEKISEQDYKVLVGSLKPMGKGNIATSEDGIYVPVYLKTSSFPLIPGFFEKDSPLDKLNEYLYTNGLDMGIYRSGLKQVILANTDGQLPSLELGNFDIGVTHELNWDFIGIQVETDELIKNKVKEGTQQDTVFEVDFFGEGSIDTYTDREGNKRNIKEDIELMNSFKNELVRRNKEKIYEKFGIKQTPQGLRVTKKKELLDFILDKGHKSDFPLPLIQSIKYILSDNSSSGSINVIPGKNRIESAIQSIINKNINSEYFGGQNAAIPENGRFKFEKVESEEVKFYTVNEYGGLNAAEVILPSYFRSKFKIGTIVDISKIEDKRLLESYAFRIPTQGPNSLDVFVVKDFLPESSGNVVIVPKGFTAKTGADFDFDKLFMHYPEFNIVKGKPVYAEYIDYQTDKSKKLAELYNSKYGRFNKHRKAFEFLKYVKEKSLKDKAAYIEQAIKQGLGIEEVKALREEIIESGLLLETMDTGTPVDYNYYKKLEDFVLSLPLLEEFIAENIGKSNIELNSEKAIKNKILEIKKSILLSPERAADFLKPDNSQIVADMAEYIESLTGQSNNMDRATYEQLTDLRYNLDARYKNWAGAHGIGIAALHNQHHPLSQKAGIRLNVLPGFVNFEGIEYDEGYSLAKVYDTSGNKISKTISQLLSAFVDNTNDPIVFRLNLNPYTESVALALVRLGVDFKTVSLFLNQPIIIDYVKELSKNSYLGEPKMKWEILNKVAKDYKLISEDGSFRNLNDTGVILNSSILEKELTEKQTKVIQKQVLLDFVNKYTSIASAISDLTQITGVNRSLAGQNFSYNEIINHKLRTILDSDLFTNVDKLLKETQLSEKYNMVVDSEQMFNELKLDKFESIKRYTDKFKRDYFSKNIFVDELSSMYDRFKNNLVTYIVQNSVWDGKTINSRMKELVSGQNSVAKRIAIYKKKYPEINNRFLDEVVSEISDSGGLDIIKFFNRFMTSQENELITLSMYDLWKATPESKELVEDIVKVSFLSAGPYNMSNVIPPPIFLSTVDKMLKVIGDSNGDFLNTFYRVHHQNSRGTETFKALPTIKGKASSKLLIKQGRQSGYPFAKLYSREHKQFLLYEFIGMTEENKEVWSYLNWLGKSGRFVEMSNSNSIISENLIEFNNKTSSEINSDPSEDIIKKDNSLKADTFKNYRTFFEKMGMDTSKMTDEQIAKEFKKYCQG